MQASQFILEFLHLQIEMFPLLNVSNLGHFGIIILLQLQLVLFIPYGTIQYLDLSSNRSGQNLS